MMRSILAVLAGFVVSAVTVTVANLLALTLIEPVAWGSTFLLVNVMSGFIFAALGGYVAAILSRRHPIVHASALGVVMLLLGVLVVGLRGEHPPFWYLPLFTLGRAGFAVVGGCFAAVQGRRRSTGIAAV